MSTDKLGQILLARGWVGRAELARAEARVGEVGQRLDTSLLEEGLIEEDRLLRGLSELHGVPAVSVDELRQVPEESAELLPAKLAARCRAVPLRLLGNTLEVALEDPANLACEDEIAFATGHRVKVHVTTEVRLAEALGRLYAHHPSSSMASLAERLNRSRYLWRQSRPPRRPGRPGEPSRSSRPAVSGPAPPPAPPVGPVPPPEPVATAPAAAPTSPPVRSSEAGGGPASPGAAPQASSPAAAAASAGASREEEREKTAGRAPSEPTTASIRLTREEHLKIYGGEPGSEAQIRDAEERLAKATERDAVGAALLDILAARFTRAAVFAARPDRVEGWMARGPEVDAGGLRRLSIPLDRPSVFLNLKAGTRFHLGPLPPLPSHRELVACWQGRLSDEALFVPVHLRDRLVAVLYGDEAGEPLAGVDLPSLHSLAERAATALERCIVLKKKRQADPESS